MIRVVTPSRLHFGLIAPSTKLTERTDERLFGGAGLMIEKPGLIVEMTSAPVWSCEGPLTPRAIKEWKKILRRAEWLFKKLPRHRIRITEAPREHVGLGTGTQLALALAGALLETIPHHGIDLSRLTGRGMRSAIGLHGFSHGGFMVDGGVIPWKPAVPWKRTARIAPLVARHEFPDAWRVVLVIPRTAQGCHGKKESLAFEKLAPPSKEFRDAQCARLLLEILPALADGDCTAFSETLHHYNRQAGEPFRLFQGGPYCSPEVEGLVKWIRDLGIPGTGQSSWGPTVFAIIKDAEEAQWLVDRLREKGFGDRHDIVVTKGDNRGARVTVE